MRPNVTLPNIIWEPLKEAQADEQVNVKMDVLT